MRVKQGPNARTAPVACEVHVDRIEEARATQRSAGVVTRFGLLAADMPSVLQRLRPMDTRSAGMLDYLFGQTRIVGPDPPRA